MKKQDLLANEQISIILDKKENKQNTTDENLDENKTVKDKDVCKHEKSSVLDLKVKEKKFEKIAENCAEMNTATARSEELSKNDNAYFREYCANASLHGIKYIGDRSRTITERIWWLLIFVVSFLICMRSIILTWEQWDKAPIVTNADPNQTPLWHIPFPAVTICPETRVRQSVYNFTEALNKYQIASEKGNIDEVFNSEELRNIEDASLICDAEVPTGPNTSNSILDFIHKVAPQLDAMIHKCIWSTSSIDKTCKELFRPLISDKRMCYSFNMLGDPDLFNSVLDENQGHKTNWNVFEGYNKGVEEDVYPLRALGHGLGLTIFLRNYAHDTDYSCNSLTGFMISIHNPSDFPGLGMDFIRVSPNQEVSIEIIPNVLTTSNDLKRLHPSRRHCYFENEKKLRFYKVYTERNCLIECHTKFMLNSCGCVAYYMPRTNSTPICGIEKMNCMKTAHCKYVYGQENLSVASKVCHEMNNAMNDSNITEENVESEKNKIDNCNCLPTCNTLDYAADAFKNEFHWSYINDFHKINSSELLGYQMTRVNVYFKFRHFTTSRRSQLYGPIDFLANCGGLLGIFMGFSFLSVMEIVYFLTLRIWCNIKIKKRKM